MHAIKIRVDFFICTTNYQKIASPVIKSSCYLMEQWMVDFLYLPNIVYHYHASLVNIIGGV